MLNSVGSFDLNLGRAGPPQVLPCLEACSRQATAVSYSLRKQGAF
jgi:hypothetical protein